MELQRRNINEGGFLSYCQAHCIQHDLTMARHHRFMVQKLERAMTVPGYNLMISMPPGHAKSTYASLLAPTYYLGKFPNKSVIMTTHTQEFSDQWGRDCRRIISSEEYQHYFQTSLRRDSSAASRFDLTNGSKYYGSGILGNVTGKRADLAIGDDWLRGIEDADSEVMRQKLWRAYLWDLNTRLKPGGSKIIIATRWHEDDPIGRILLSKDRENWDVINLPAIAEQEDILGRQPGEALWPDYITLKMLTDIRDSLNKEDIRMWNSLYQQKPTLDSGFYFIKEWMQYINKLPEGLDYYGASDYAVSEGKGDYTVHAIIGYDAKNDDIYIVKIWRERTTPDVWVEEFINLALHYKTLVWAEESGQIIKSVDPFIVKELRNRNKFIFREQFTCAVDKAARARAFQAYMAQKKVYILNDDWTDELTKEMLAFPNGRHDDQVDALGLIGRLLKELVLRVEKKTKKAEYDYESGRLRLPDLNDDISPKEGYYPKI